MTTETTNIPAVRIFELINQQDTSFTLEGTENSANPLHIRTSALERIPNISTRKRKVATAVMKNRPESGGPQMVWERIRYIKGCPTIIESEQKAQGWVPNLATGADDIVFVWGKHIIYKDVDPQLEEFLLASNNNVTNEDRKPDTTPLFKELSTEQEATEAVDDFFTRRRVTDFFAELAIEQTGGKGYKLNEERIDSLCSLLGLAGHETPTIKLKALMDLAEQDPKAFLKTVTDQKAEKVALVKQSLEFGVTQWNDRDFVVVEGNRKVFTVPADTKEENKVYEVAQFLLSGDGLALNAQLSLAVKFELDKRLQGN